jgi:hypothetical protein
MVRARTIGVCAAPVPVMAVQVSGPSAVWMDRTALAPSPTAHATRLTEVSRTSQAAKAVGVAPNSAGFSWASVRMNPLCRGQGFPSHSVAGSCSDEAEQAGAWVFRYVTGGIVGEGDALQCRPI